MQEEQLKVIQNQTIIYPFRKQRKYAPMYSKCCNQSTYLGKACEILACQKAESDGQSWAWANHLEGK